MGYEHRLQVNSCLLSPHQNSEYTFKRRHDFFVFEQTYVGVKPADYMIIGIQNETYLSKDIFKFRFEIIHGLT